MERNELLERIVGDLGLQDQDVELLDKLYSWEDERIEKPDNITPAIRIEPNYNKK